MLPRKNKEKENRKAFTLIEIIVAMFIFVLIIAGSSVVFAKLFQAYARTKELQQGIDNAQYAINLMSKVFRTSSVVAVGTGDESITVFNYSQNRCLRYEFANNILWESESPATSKDTCAGSSFGAPQALTTGQVSGRFIAIPSQGAPNAVVGRVTIIMAITTNNSIVNLESSVSLRDYGVSDILN